MPKDSKNGFYRQEQNIGSLIAPFAGTSSPHAVRRAPWSYTPPRAHTMAVYAARPPSRPLAVRTARAPLR